MLRIKCLIECDSVEMIRADLKHRTEFHYTFMSDDEVSSWKKQKRSRFGVIIKKKSYTKLNALTAVEFFFFEKMASFINANKKKKKNFTIMKKEANKYKR